MYSTLQIMIILIPLLPLLAFLANGLFGKALGHAGGWLAVACMGGSAAIGGYIFWAAIAGKLALPVDVALWQWMAVDGLDLRIGFHVDQLTALMLFFVTFVSTLVFIYSVGYMHGDPGFNRFFAYLGLFDFSMLVLVLADSLPVLFIGWEGVGLCSYLLIGYYLAMPGAADAGKKAFIVNRIGDFGLLVAMFMLFHVFGSLNIQHIVEGAVEASRTNDLMRYGAPYITWLTLAIFLGCTGKSAQIPLFVWLPDAMAGPTPVSALIHAATMVTAGVYLVVRMSALFALAPATMAIIAIIGCATAFVAGSIALTQRDIKKVLAYSTVSQLGYMFLACGVGAFVAGIFHVFTHAFFKACLFLGAGSVIHAAHHEQDLHKFGGLKKYLPKTRITYLIACLGLAGIPPLAGFFSKDEILWQTFAFGSGKFLWVVGVLTALMTAFYSFRSYFLTFEGECRLDEHTKHHLHESPNTMTLPLIILAAGTLLAGFMNVPSAFTHHEGIVSRFLEPVMEPTTAIINITRGEAHEYAHSTEFALMALSIGLVCFGIFLAFYLCLKIWPDGTRQLTLKPVLRGLYRFSLNRWYWDDFYNVFVAGGLWVASVAALAFDRWIIDGLFLHGASRITRGGSSALRLMQNGQVQLYTLAILLGANILLMLVFFIQW